MRLDRTNRFKSTTCTVAVRAERDFLGLGAPNALVLLDHGLEVVAAARLDWWVQAGVEPRRRVPPAVAPP